jgi:hypothetical protein
MGRKGVRDRPLTTANAALVCAAFAVAVHVYLLPLDERDTALKYGEFVVALAGVTIAVLGLLRRARGQAEPRPVDTLADLLAQKVYGQWRNAATERVLLVPTPIPLRWSLSSLEVTGHVAAATGGAGDGPPAFPPLPGQAAVTEAQLRAIGGRRELHALYSGIASGRVVVLGAPGAGKTGTAILLLLDALEHRDSLDDTARARAPVPVLFTAHGWDPNTCSVQDWLSTELATNYRMFQHRRGNLEAAALVTAEKVALILDGLDEMPAGLRPAALQALSDAPFRVVLLTRNQEMVNAARRRWLVGAIAVQLHDVAGPDAADYLQRALTGPPPAGWARLLTTLCEHPYGVLARGLSTPGRCAKSFFLVRDFFEHRGRPEAMGNLRKRLCATPCISSVN